MIGQNTAASIETKGSPGPRMYLNQFSQRLLKHKLRVFYTKHLYSTYISEDCRVETTGIKMINFTRTTLMPKNNHMVQTISFMGNL